MPNNPKSNYRIWKETDADDLQENFLNAIYQGNTRVVQKCIDQGIDTNLTDDDELTALHHAAIRGDVAMGQVLLSAPTIDIDKKDREGLTALMWATLYQNEDFLKLLLEKDADPNLINMKKKTALHIASTNDSLRITDLLISKGAHVNVLDAFDNTPVSIAVIDRGSIRLTALLLRRGANVTSVKRFPLLLGELGISAKCSTSGRDHWYY